MVTDAGGALYGLGREPYQGYNEAINYLRDAVLLPEDTFADLRIPEGFATPQAFVHAATNFSNMLDSHAARLEELNTHSGGHWHRELSYAYRVCTKTRDAINHALSLADVTVEAPPLKRLVKMLERLPTVSRVIAKDKRREKRDTLEITDEYDVQDLMNGVLHLEFDDIRPEVWIPSYAGTNSRTDFLLPDEGIIIEAKHTKNGAAQTTVVEELTIDIARYKTYPNVKHLVCAIWDTGHHLKNPAALSDLERHNPGFVTVVVMT
ncbi:hypothetical protein WI37_20205 [Burkholderia ubonensis]|nr:hypothetical protein WI37_20205 [Burkholderia ubonensis]